MRRSFFILLLVCVALTAQVDFIAAVRTYIARDDFATAQSLINSYKSQRGVTPELIEAISWMARGELAKKDYPQAESYASQALDLCRAELSKHSLDQEQHLPLAFGNAIEVHAQVLADQGRKQQAISYLKLDLQRYGSTSIATRLQKNINMLTLQGAPAPALDERQFLGPKPVPLTMLRGKPVLLFFWAHWCVDCKGDEPIIARVRSDFASNGLTVIAPTQLYGYVAQGMEATPQQELPYVEQIRHTYYSDLADVPAPVSEANFRLYGASTTPTLVLVDRAGRVAMYHPGAMTYDELRSEVEKVLR